MANDLAAMKARIARDLARPDFTSSSQDIADAINTAIAAYQGDRFRFSDANFAVPPTFLTQAGRANYNILDNANIGTLIKFDYVMIQIGNTLQELTRTDAADIQFYNQVNTMQGQPTSYAYRSNQILLAPVPSDVWTVTLAIFREVPAPANDTEADNHWMIDGELLIRSRAKYEIATHRTRNPLMAAAMSPDPPAPGQPAGAAYRAWCALKSEANRVNYSGRIKPMRF